MKYIEKTHIRTHIYTHIRMYARERSTVHTVHTVIITKNTRKGKHEMTTNDITILVIMAAWLMFIRWIMR